MNKLKIGLLCLTIGSSLNGFGQLSDFDLSKYKLPDLERRTLETDFNISGYNNYNKTPDQTFYAAEETRTNQYSGNFYMNYNHYINNSKYQRESNLRLDFSSDFYKRKENKEALNKNNNIAPALYYQLENRKYYNGSSFFETDFALDYQYRNNKRYSKSSFEASENKENLQTHVILAYIPIKLGTGRIEPVQDARHAVYLFDELSKIKRLSSDKSDEEIIEFAELISQLKNKRFFDSRLRRMAEIESLDSFLISNNYIPEQDARYFTTLSDFWAYGNRQLRNSGTRFSGVIRPGYYFDDFNNTGDGLYFIDNKYNLSALLLDAGIEYKREKPINLFWQNSIDLNCFVGIIEGRLNDKTNSVENKIRIPNIQLGFYQTIGFFPNTRTEMNFRYSVQYVQLFDKSDLQKEILGAEGKGAKGATELSINYYISPKFRLNFASSFYYVWQDSKDEAIINFDNVAGSNYLLSNFNPDNNVYRDYFKVNEIANRFSISLSYSIF